MLTEEHHAAYASLMAKGHTWQSAAAAVAADFKLKAPPEQLAFSLEMARLNRSAASRSPVVEDPATVEVSQPEAAAMTDPDDDIRDLWDQALDMATELDIPPELKKRVLKRIARVGLRIGAEAVDTIERELLREIADFRLRDPEKLRRRAAKKEARGNTERAEELRALASSIETGL